MSKIFIFLSVAFLAFVSFTHDVNSSVTIPVVEEEIDVSNHKILDIFRSYNQETVLMLDDGSSWLVQEHLDAEERECIIGAPVSFMPTAGKDHLDRFIVHQRRDRNALDVESLNYSRYSCHKIADISGNELTLFLDCDGQTKTFYVSEDSLETVSLWSEGDPILIGGIWFDEFDSQERGISACVSFTLYNYRYQEFVFTHLPN